MREPPADVRIRRVGFRYGSDEELTALHAVESEVEAERRPDRVPQPLDSYISFARSLPSHFNDHTWVAEVDDDSPAATAACWSDTAGDPRLMECDVVVRRRHRQQGIGSRLMQVIAETAAAEERALLTWSTFEAVPAGESFARRLGGRVARVNRTSDLRLADVDWAMVADWIRQGPDRAPGYRMEVITGPFPPALHADAARFHHIMQTAPRDELDAGDVVLDPADIAEHDRHLAESGRERWTILVRDPAGACVGGTEVTFEPWDPAVVLQQNTGIDPAHRGQGLAKWAKAAMLERIRTERPEAERVRTGNAFSNAPMLAVNDALGFKVISTRTEWQAEVVTVLDALAR